MPELPDVETYRRYINTNALHQRIQSVQVRDDAILEGITAKSLQARLKGNRFKSTLRHGKNLFVEISGASQWLRIHFGMTGWPAYVTGADEVPRHSQVIFEFGHDRRLAYVDPRKFGSIGLIESAARYIKSKNLGPDALKISPTDFRNRVGRHRGSIKPVLLDQQVVAGVGNVYADELLFHCRTHPKARLEFLDPAQLDSIHGAMLSILKKAVEAEADIQRFPRSWLLPHRRRGGKCPRCRTPWQFVTVGGRTTCFCPTCQSGRS